MKLKKIIASLTAAAMAITTMAFAPLSVSADALNAAPTGTEKVIAKIENYTASHSGAMWDGLGCANSDWNVDISSYMNDPDVYVKLVASVTSTYEISAFQDWAYAAKWYTNDYEVQFKATNDSTMDNYVSYAPLSDFQLTMSDGSTHQSSMQANVQMAFATAINIKSFDIIKVETVNYIETVIKPEDTYTGDVLLTKDVDFDSTSLSADAKLRVYYKTGVGTDTEGGNSVSAGWGIGKIGSGTNETWWTESNKASDITSEGANKESYVDVPFSKFVSGYEVIGIQAYESTSCITKVSILDTSAVVIPSPVKSVTVTPSTAALVVGDTTTLTAEVLPADATDPSITWASSDEKVATVDKNGKVTAVAEGKATITATSNADDTVFGSCAVTVVSPEAEKYAVNVIKPENGTVTVKGGKTEAYADETIELVITPDTDYALDTVTVNGKNIIGTSFTMPAEDVTVEVIFKKLGSADAEVVAPEGVSVAFAGSEEDILKAVFGDDYAALVEAGYKLDVVMTVKDESAVSADDKALIEGELSDDMHIGLLVDVSLVKTQDGVSTAVASSSKPVSFVIGVPDSIIADGRTYSVIRVHDGKAENIGGTYDAANKTITVSSDKFSAYAVVYKDAPAPQPESKPAVTYYSITAGRNVTASASSAAAGTQINVRVDFGYDAYVLCGGKTITKITESGSFTMPAGKVTIVTEANGYLAMVKNAAPNSYIFVYDADMNYIKTNGSVKGIKGEGKITVKLGEEYAGKTVTLYKGRKSTSTELDSKTLDDNGNATFTVEGGKNYTAVVE